MAKVRRVLTSSSMVPSRAAAVVFTLISSSNWGGPYSIVGQTVIPLTSPLGHLPLATVPRRDNMADAMINETKALHIPGGGLGHILFE